MNRTPDQADTIRLKKAGGAGEVCVPACRDTGEPEPSLTLRRSEPGFH